MKKTDRLGLRTWLEIDKKAIAHNYKVFRALISPQTKMMAVVKSNAYGHNLFEYAKEMEKLGADWLGVDSVVEGLALRREGCRMPILVLGYTLPEMLAEAVKNDISLTLSNFDYFKDIAKLPGKDKLAVHLKVNSGMNRQGFAENEMLKVLRELGKLKDKIKVEGLYTHFAAAKNPSFPADTRKQMAVFEKWQKALEKAGHKVLAHAGATSGTMIFPESHYDMVRAGIGIYGLWPSAEVRAYLEPKYKLLPVLAWKSLIAETKIIEKGEGVGYDLSERVNRKTKIAIIPIGYWHGYPRALSSVGSVLIAGERAKVLGRVCMDMIMVDVTDIKSVKVGDEATLLGREGKEEISADDLALLSGTSCYEIVTRINPLIKRIYI